MLTLKNIIKYSMDGNKSKSIFLIISVFFILCFAANVKAAGTGDSINFNIDNNFDASARTQIQAVLVKTSPNLYFYVDKSWWDQQAQAKQNEILTDLDNLSNEFSNKIY